MNLYKKHMNKNRRYSVSLDAYMYAMNDREAMVKAAKFVEFLQTLDDNQAQVTELYETPFSSLQSREVHKGRLTIFENKLIEV